MSQGLREKSSVFEHFTVTEDDKNYFCTCKVNSGGESFTCGTKISKPSNKKSNISTRAFNLKRHIRNQHPDVFKIIEENDKVKISNTASSPSSSSASKSKISEASQPNLTKYFTSQKVTVSMTPEQLKNNIIELVVKNSLPLSVFCKPAMRGLIGEMAEKFKVSLDRSNIRRLIIDKANEEKNVLKSQLKGRFIFLKMDGCTRLRINYFGINVRFVDANNKIITRTLAVRDTQSQHSSEYLHKLVKDVLLEYEIEDDHILCIVTDNASNMISTIDKLNENKVADEENEIEIVGSNLETSDSEVEPELQVQSDDDDNAELDLNCLIEEFESLSKIYHMRCGVHTLQLAIRDGLAEKHASTLLSRMRQVVVAARKPKLEQIIKRRSGKVAILDQVTRWGSTYMMIERLLELKPVLIDMANPEVTLSEVMWAQVQKLQILLYQPYIVTKKIQDEDLTPGQFFKEWKSLIYFLNNAEGTIAEGIKTSMEKRENILLENDVMLAAVYLDPKYRCLLTDEQQRKAKDAVWAIAIRMKNPQEISQAVIENISVSSSPTTSDNEFDFEKILDKQHGAHSKRPRLECQEVSRPLVAPLIQLTKFKLSVFESFIEVEKFNRQSKISVEDAIIKYPEIIRDVAQVVIALPPTQVSVERLFSVLKIIKSDLRAVMKEDLIEAILFLRTNCFT